MHVKVIGFAILVHIVSTYYVHKIGSDHYHPHQAIKRNLDKVWDVCHKYFPNVHHLDYLANIIFLIPLIIVICSGSPKRILDDVLLYFPIILIIRSLMIFVTILPKHKRCDSGKLTWKSFVVGHCYDKIFSGHFSLFLLVTLSMLRYNVINSSTTIALNLLNALIILLTRSHYTTDIIIAFFITQSVYNNCYSMNIFS